MALESDLVRQGLLTYALIEDGLVAEQADFQPRDKRIMLGEWLRYGTRRVPELAVEILRGRVQTFQRGARRPKRPRIIDAPVLRRSFQQPALFDFTKRTEDMPLDQWE